MASVPEVADRFEMGRVVSRAFGTMGRNLGLIIGLTLLVVALPNLLLRPLNPDPATITPGNVSASWLWLLTSSLVAVFCNYILLAALTYTMVTDMDGSKPTFGKALGVGLRFMFPLLLLTIVSMSGIYFGLFLLAIPGLILAVMWSVAAPAMVSENLGVFASLGRSRALTKGSRWRIFGLLAVAFVLTFLPLALVPLLSGTFDTLVAEPLGPVAILQTLLSAFAMLILIAIDAAIYVELRAVKEGASSRSLASIFA
jgi:hypothetical protein